MSEYWIGVSAALTGSAVGAMVADDLILEPIALLLVAMPVLVFLLHRARVEESNE